MSDLKKLAEVKRITLIAEYGMILSEENENGAWVRHSDHLAAVTALLQEVETLRAENMCDACAGTGTPVSGLPCMCGGTGKMSVAAIHLREQLARHEEAAPAAQSVDCCCRHPNAKRPRPGTGEQMTTEELLKLCDEVIRDPFEHTASAVEVAYALRARLTESAPGVEGWGDVQERGPAPLTFFTQIACNAYAAAATRDDVSHYDAMRVALQAVDDARYKPPASTAPTNALAPQSGKKEDEKAYTYNVVMPSEHSAGLRGFTEQVRVVVASGNPGGEDGEFAEHMRQCLTDWFDGAGVKLC